MTHPHRFSPRIFQLIAAVALGLSALAAQAQVSLLNVSYDPTREL